jgi:hypothetical protein
VLPLCMGLVRIFNVTDCRLLSCVPGRLAGELHCDETLALVVLGVIVRPLAGALSGRVDSSLGDAAGCAGFFRHVPVLLLIRRVASVSVAFFGGAAVWVAVESAGWGAVRVRSRCGEGRCGRVFFGGVAPWRGVGRAVVCPYHSARGRGLTVLCTRLATAVARGEASVLGGAVRARRGLVGASVSRGRLTRGRLRRTRGERGSRCGGGGRFRARPGRTGVRRQAVHGAGRHRSPSLDDGGEGS